MNSVEVLEVGPRDGLQNEKRTLPIDTRVELINRLVAAGARRIEAVSFVHPTAVPQMADAEKVMDGLPDVEGVSYQGLVLNTRGAHRAVETRISEINFVIPVTDDFAQRNQRRTSAELVAECEESIAVARAAGKGVSVTLAVAFGCPFSGGVAVQDVARVLDPVLEMDIDEIAFADTIGLGVPRQVTELADLVRPLLGSRRLRFHFHNTRNTGYANALAAAELDRVGTVVLDSAVGGFGGCPFAPAATGNIGTEDLVYALRASGIQHTDLSISALSDTAVWLGRELDSPIQSLLPKAGDFPANPARQY
ncbi:hydroxymethylglutaryl-CoA lyase [Dietzia alimentaria]|uniref:hydroxymethylglutaryl-CoA lyase n=1 Tax=Dietzia alimentaria TaxID=665550 RepID=UPI00029A4B65|nr:hydroxymethylglutaryl-CoA lyase [Dietzia alimentaria]